MRKLKKIFLLFLLLVVTFALNVAKFFKGEKTSQAQAQECWKNISGTTSGGCSSGGYPDACAGTSGSACSGGGCAGGSGCAY